MDAFTIMAVKQYSTENSQRPENLKYNITKILEYIEELENTLGTIGNDFTTICKKIVDLLGHVDIPTEPESIAPFGENILRVEEFLEKLMKNDNTDIVFASLKELYKIIMTIENPSPAAGIVLHRFDPQWIPKATKWYLNNTDNTSDEDIKRGVKTLCQWIRFSHFLHNLDRWVIGILNGLREQHKFDLLLDIALENIDHLFFHLSIPILYKHCISVVTHILCSIHHTPVVFHRALNRFPKTYLVLQRCQIDCTQLVDTIAALMIRFPGYAQYKSIDIKPSTDFKNHLNVPPWHDESKNEHRNTNARVGLVNLGNTCYMNSVLQALVMTKQFTRGVLLYNNRTSMLFQNMQRLLALLLHSLRPQLTPKAVLASARPSSFQPGHEQDSSEFLDHLLDKLHEQEQQQFIENNASFDGKYLNGNTVPMDIDGSEQADDTDIGACAVPSGSNCVNNPNEYALTEMSPNPHPQMAKTLIQDSFGGNISITYKCLNCETESKHFDSFRDLHLSFPDSATVSTENHSVQDLINFYCSKEKLDADNKYFCDNCKTLCDGERFINIVTAPKHLILTLKHFKYDQKYNMRAKLMHKVCHEEEITVKVRPKNDGYEYTQKYRLYAAVVHSGVSMETGHYFTYAADHTGWYKFDDNFVAKCTASELHGLQPPHTPYILFYQMVDNPKISATPSSLVILPPLSPITASAAASANHTDSTTNNSTNSNVSNQLANNNNNATVKLYEYPALEELPPLLREYVNLDNVQYTDETRSSIKTSVFLRNRKNDYYDRDDSDEPPNSCGGNFAPSYNRYIT